MMLFNDSMVTYKWRWRSRNWRQEVEDWKAARTEVLVDPLTSRSRRRKALSNALRENFSQEPAVDFADPLGVTKVEETESIVTKLPASLPISEVKPERELVNTLLADVEEASVSEKVLSGFEPWSTKKRKILEEFKTNEKLTITSSFLPNGVPLKTEISITDRTAHRLEQINDSTGLKKLADLSQEEYIRSVNELRKKLLVAWANERKVESVKIVVELSRILSSTAAPHFYPSQFVLVTDILDIFGELVYERLRAKSNKERADLGLGPLPNSFSVSDVPETTRETAKNWFCKIGDIVELLPRFYVEASIIGCIRFLDSESLSANLLRLCGMLLSVPHPLVASYARAYICRVSMRLLPADRAPHWKCLNDWMQSFSTQPTALLLPAMEWVVQCVTYNAITYDDLLPLWEYCRSPDKRSIILRPFLSSAAPNYICEHAVGACKLVTQSDEVTAQELCAFGEQLLKGETPEDARKMILRNVWRRISKLPSIRGFVECIVVWIEFAARYFSLNETSIMLESLIKRIKPDKKYESFYDSLLAIVEKLVSDRSDIAELFTVESFLQMISLFRCDTVTTKCSTIVLTAFIGVHPMRSSSNFQLANQILVLCKRLHDSLSVSASDTETQTATFLIERSLDRFELNFDPERALDYFVDCRAALSNIDSIVAYLVTRVCALGYSVVERGSVSRTGATFLRACIANSFITVASLSDPMQRLQLYLQCAMLGLLANSLPQVDAAVKCCIELLASCADVPVVQYRSAATAFLAFLVYVPDSPSRPPLYMFSGFLNAISRYPWRAGSLERGWLLIECLFYLSTVAQAELPNHIGSVQSNDSIYGNSKEFLEAITEKSEVVMGQLEEIIRQDASKTATLAAGVLEALLSVGDVEQLGSLVVELYSRAAFLGDRTPRYRALKAAVQKITKTSL